MEFIIAAVLFVVLVGAWVVLPAEPAKHAPVAKAENPENMSLKPSA
jgi:hypothetical protein